MSELSVGQIKGLPVNDNIISIPAGHTLVQPGMILQVQQTVKTDIFAATPGAVWADIPGLSVDITPKFATSKILVMVDLKLSGSADSSISRSKIQRNNADIYVGDAAGSRPRSMAQFYIAGSTNIYHAGPNVGIFLDSPGITSLLTYKMQMGGDANASIIRVNITQGDRNTAYVDSRTASSITVMEIAQ